MSVLIATKVKDAEIWLSRFITQVEQFEGNIDRIVAMYGKSRDKTFPLLDHWRHTSKHNVEIYSDPPREDIYEIPHGARLTHIKKDIQKRLKASAADYYLNLDCDLVRMPPDLIPRLMAHDVDLIAAMTWTEGRPRPIFFDTYEYRMDGCQFHPINPPGFEAKDIFNVDSVSTCYLAKSEVELAGTYSNPYPHIPFCKTLRDQGYKIWVDPQTHVYHIDLLKLGIGRAPLPIKLSMAPYIDAKGSKFTTEQVMASLHHLDRLNYDMNLLTSRPEWIEPAYQWLRERPLITASYKVHPDEYEFLPYSIASIYDHVDIIQIATGPIALRERTFKDRKLKLEDPEGKIQRIHRNWRDKQEIQATLLEKCRSKWMLFIDGDEVIEGMDVLRDYCAEHPDGDKVYARPGKFLNFWHDFQHIAYSLNPLSPWAATGTPHAFLIHRDIPGLNFGMFHTIPIDGFGLPVHSDEPSGRSRRDILDKVTVYHFGNAKRKKPMRDKLNFEKERGIGYLGEVNEDPWFTGDMSPDMVLEEYPGTYPEALLDHPRLNQRLIEITAIKPLYKFRRIS